MPSPTGSSRCAASAGRRAASRTPGTCFAAGHAAPPGNRRHTDRASRSCRRRAAACAARPAGVAASPSCAAGVHGLRSGVVAIGRGSGHRCSRRSDAVVDDFERRLRRRTATPHMSSKVAGSSTTPRPTASPLKRPSSASCDSGVGHSGGAQATLRASSSNSGPQRSPGRPMIW